MTHYVVHLKHVILYIKYTSVKNNLTKEKERVFPTISILFFTSRETVSMEVPGDLLSTSIRLRGLACGTYRSAESCLLMLNPPSLLNSYPMKKHTFNNHTAHSMRIW